MKLTHLGLTAAALLGIGAMSAPAIAAPHHDMHHRHKVCQTHWQHGHKVRHCAWR